MQRLLLIAGPNIAWIDHHSSALEAYALDMSIPPTKGKRDISKAACELTWEYLFPDRPVPLAVKLLSLYDSWTYQGHELENMVLPFQIRMRMEDLDPKEEHHKWVALLEEELLWIPAESCSRSVNWLIEDGLLLLRYDEKMKAEYARTYAFETELIERELMPSGLYAPKRTYKAIAVNLGHTNSKVFDSVWRRVCTNCNGTGGRGLSVSCTLCNGTGYIEPYDLMITFCRRKDKLWNVSLYSTKDLIDCGAIAKFFGGGGHKGAAGMQVKELPFEM